MWARATLYDADGNAIGVASPLYVTGTLTSNPGNTSDTKITMDGEIVGVTGNPTAAVPATIALGEATSGEINLGGNALVGIFTPSALTNATISILAATVTGGTFARINNESSQPISIAVATNASRAIGLDLYALCASPWRYIKLQTGVATSPATEAATRTFWLVTK